MKVCDIVLNSIWYDPRVKRQINTYTETEDVTLSCVGVKCARYDEKKVNELNVDIELIEEPKKKPKLLPKIVWRVYRRRKIDKMLTNAIVKQKPDVIHANDFSALKPAYTACKKLKCALVYDSHEVYMSNQLPYGKLYVSFLKSVERRIARKANVMVCVSNAAADYFAKEFDIEKPLVVTNCAHKGAIVRENGDKNQGFEILNHGQFYEGRGYDIAVEGALLLNDCPDVKIALRGFGRMEEGLKEYVNKNNVSNVIFYPPVTVQELIPQASRSHVGVAITEPICLNFKLSVSNKLFEYAAAGLPVIMSDIPEHRYLNEKYDFGIIIPENTPKAFAEAVKTLYEDKALYEKYSKNALAMAEKVNWENEFFVLLQKEREAVSNLKR